MSPPQQRQTLDGGAGSSGLWPNVVTNGAIDHARWLRTCAEGGFVGACSCGGYLTPRRPEDVGRRTDYAATCAACGKEIDAPGGRIHSRRRGG